MQNKLILGTVQFGLKYGINNLTGKIVNENIKSILDLAFENGIQILDTAESYGDSQKKIGEYHLNSGNKFKIITKFSSKTNNLSSNIVERILTNLKILNVDSLYAYMFHSFSDFENYFTLFRDDLVDLKRKKIVLNIGVSLYTNDELEKVLKFNDIDLVQIPFNLLDNNNKRENIFKKAKERGVEIHTRSVFLQGLFFVKIPSLSSNLVDLTSDLNLLHDLCDQDYQISDLALNYACSKNYIDKVLIGVDNIDHLKSNLYSLRKKISKKIINKIEVINVEKTELLNPSNW